MRRDDDVIECEPASPADLAAIRALLERRGARAAYLLTTTAEGFFSRAGYTRLERAAVPAAVAETSEFRALCPASAVCMVRAIR